MLKNIKATFFTKILLSIPIYGENDKGKEYKFQNDLLIFKGEYLNGKRNGKGKEFENYKLKFKVNI